MRDKFEVEIKIYGESLEIIKRNVDHVARHILVAKSMNAIPMASGGGGPTGGGLSFSITCKSPIPERIKTLRDEADRLEESL